MIGAHTKRTFGIDFLAGLIALIVLAGPAAGQTTIFVDDDVMTSGTGGSWGDPFKTLGEALTAANAGDSIHVAQGTYTAPWGGFALKNEVHIFGGFAGPGAANPDLRDPIITPSVLTGAPSAGACPTNQQVLSAIFLATETIIDGLTITGGNAPCTSGASAEGGGLNSFQSVITAVNCRFTGNHATRGGGVFSFQSTCQFIDCRFDGNTGTNGGGIYVFDGDNQFLNCTVNDNNVSTNGGGVYRGGTGGTLVFDDSVFADNHAHFGGGVNLINHSPGVDFLDCVFDGNSTTTEGGGLRGLDRGMSVINCLFVNNSAATVGGGAISITNTLSAFTGPFVINSTLTQNSTGNSGEAGGIHLENSSARVEVINTILWANSNASGNGEEAQIDWFVAPVGDGPIVTYSIIQGRTGVGLFNDPSNSGDNPLFNDAPAGNFSLDPTSPAIDAGDDSAVTLFDITGDLLGGLRILDDHVDMGAIESPGVFDSDGDGLNDDEDECANSDLSPTIIINGVDSGVANELLEDGCTLVDLIEPLLANDPSTAEVVQFLVDLKAEGLISGKDMGAILKAMNTP